MGRSWPAAAIGSVGGLAGTVAMDLVMTALFAAMGLPVDYSVSFIGDTAAAGFAAVGIGLPGGPVLGTVMHCAIGLALGAAFGLLVAATGRGRLAARGKAVAAGIAYIELVSLPILATAPLLLPMATVDVARWLGLSLFMHAICGAVLGLVVRRGLQGNAPRRTTRRAAA